MIIMRDLFTIDRNDYASDMPLYIRPSARAIIIKDKKVALVYSKKYDYYKFPGGGINENENKIDALIREVKEETGLIVIKESINSYGKVLRIKKLDDDRVFYQENYYYLCDVVDKIELQNLDDYEKDEEFTLVFVDPITAIVKNLSSIKATIRGVMIERDVRVLKVLIEEGVILK